VSTSSLGRVVEVAEDGRHLAKDRGFLTVAERGTEISRVALDDITAVVATSPATTVSCALLADLATRGIPFVLCGRNYAPAGMLWPVAGHHAQQRRIELQAEAGKPLKKRLWALVVAAKIRAQGAALQMAGLEAPGFVFLARQVKSGDPDNLEAQAARRYWPLLMGPEFRRDTEADGANALLNYGYAVLRGSTARAIVAAGLHPGLGIFHRHPYNAMPLADDLMEPFRPLVDRVVLGLVREGQTVVSPEVKRQLAGVLHADQQTPAGSSPLESCIYRLAASLADSFVSGKAHLALPAVAAAGGAGCDAALP
jgi:CRISPR-associated protein Cas1